LRFVKASKTNVLVVCCYMADRPNLIKEIVQSVEEAKTTRIDFIVTNNTAASPCERVKPYLKYNMVGETKYRSVDKIVKEQLKPYHKYLMVIDDDVRLPENFFDEYFAIVKELGLLLSQPAYSKDSFGGFPCNRQIEGAIAHLTYFIEMGPVTCFEKRILSAISFTQGSPMGWGLDYVWSYLCANKKYRMGVVDRTPIQHGLRKPGSGYNMMRELLIMWKYLLKCPHISIFAKRRVGQIFYEKDFPHLVQ